MNDDGLTHFRVDYLVTGRVDEHPIGPRNHSERAVNWLEALNKAKLSYGPENANKITVVTVSVSAPDYPYADIYLYDLYKRGGPIPLMPRSA